MAELYDEMISSLKRLISINSVQAEPCQNAPFGKGPREALDYALALTKSFGFKTKDIDGYVGWAEIGEGDLFGILAHLDTVPLGEGWKCPPLSGEIINGELYGRGVVDDKGPFIISLYALKALLDEGKKPKMRIRLIFGCNEESGWECIDRYLLTEEIPTIAISPDGDFPVINCEKGVGHYEITLDCPECIEELVAGERVNMVPDKAYVKLNCISDVAITYALHYGVALKKEGDYWIASASGKCAHGSTPWLGENALLKIFNTIASLDDRLGVLARSFAEYDGSKMGLDFQDEVSGKLSMTVGYAKIEDGKLKIGLDIRFPISCDNEKISKALEDAFPFATVTLMHAHPSLYFDEKDPFVETLLNAYRTVTEDYDCKPLTIGGATYARALPRALAFGPVFPDRENLCHQVDERMSLEDIRKTFDIYKLAFKELCFTK